MLDIWGKVGAETTTGRLEMAPTQTNIYPRKLLELSSHTTSRLLPVEVHTPLHSLPMARLVYQVG